MNRFSLGAIALVAVAASASAEEPTPAPPPPFTWAGFYVGGSAGRVWANDKITDLDGLNDPAGFNYSLKDAGWIGSGVIGYNFQYLQFVYGIEADLGGISVGKTVVEPSISTPGATMNHLGSGFYSDVTARLGYAFDRALVYAKGGWAYYSDAVSLTNIGNFGGGTVTTGSYSGGLTIGGGIEYAFAQAWSVKVEYLHFELGSKTATLVTPRNGNFGFPNGLSAAAGTVGVSYHFGH